MGSRLGLARAWRVQDECRTKARGNLAKRLTEAMVVEKWDTAYMWNLRLGLQVE